MVVADNQPCLIGKKKGRMKKGEEKTWGLFGVGNTNNYFWGSGGGRKKIVFIGLRSGEARRGGNPYGRVLEKVKGGKGGGKEGGKKKISPKSQKEGEKIDT